MKKQLLTLLLAIAICSIVKAETEPNDTKEQANVFPINGSVSGDIFSSIDIDWFSVTTTSDGQLSFTLNSTNGKNVAAILYDHDGTTVIASTVTATSNNFSWDGLAAGTYYVRVTTYYSGETPSYSISNSFTAASVANDKEPDSSKATAITLPLNGSKTGHIGYYYNGQRDKVDFYKVTTDGDGQIQLKLTSNNGKNVMAILYDNDAYTQLYSVVTASTDYIKLDGLATGTYYVQVNNYYDGDYIPYTLGDSLFNPSQQNDAEPDSSKATALKLPLNGTKTGHVGYYFNGHRDGVDFYKITTDADGWLRIKIASNNGKTIQAILYDNDGATQLGNTATTGTGYVNAYDLAAGTYFVQVNSYYSYEFEPYTITDSLYLFGVSNDPEPDSTKATALTLALDSSEEGHVGYYYNHHRDTADFYKLTTDQDGMLRLFLTSYTGNFMQATLYDNDGSTYINTLVTPGESHLDIDGLGAGTYYIKINTYYGGQYSPYTIGDSLYTYSYANDEEPNDQPYQAKTIPANGEMYGHVDFYYNNNRNPVDWWKINYTGSGNLELRYDLEPNLKNGNISYVNFQLYKDTLQAPISDVTHANSYWYFTLSNLTQGYYYIRVTPYYAYDIASYGINARWTEASTASIKVSSYSSIPDCSNNQIVFNCSNGQAPYTVQLYRFGVPYGSAVSTTKKATFNNLPGGSYYARAYSDGASGEAYDQTKAIVLEPVVTGLNTAKITANKATLKWTAVNCAAYYSVQYKGHTATKWITRKTQGNVTSYSLSGLNANTMYDWSVAAVDSANGITAIGNYAAVINFTTASALIANVDNEQENMSAANNSFALSVSPNPATNIFTIHYNNNDANKKVNAVLYNTDGKKVWTSGLVPASTLNNMQVPVTALAKGVYYLQTVDENGEQTAGTKVVIAK